METCCTHNMMRLTRSLYARDPQIAHFDYFERALFNGILAAQDPATGMNTYFQSTRPGYVRLYHTPFDSFWCCTGSGIENHARYGESIYAHDDDALYVNLFLASTLDWRERGITLTQSTRFPDADTTRLSFTAAKPQALKLAIRHPGWCAAMTLTVNGKRKVVSRRPGSYYSLSRTFRAGDVVEVRLPMTLGMESAAERAGPRGAHVRPHRARGQIRHRGPHARFATHRQRARVGKHAQGGRRRFRAGRSRSANWWRTPSVRIRRSSSSGPRDSKTARASSWFPGSGSPTSATTSTGAEPDPQASPSQSWGGWLESGGAR